MEYHTGRIIVAIIFLIITFSAFFSGQLAGALIWALLTFAVVYPFVRGGKLDLYYDTSPPQVINIYQAPE